VPALNKQHGPAAGNACVPQATGGSREANLTQDWPNSAWHHIIIGNEAALTATVW